MTQPPPTIDERRRADLYREAIERARSYTPEWDPESGDVGTALLGLFADIAGDVTQRLNETPEKHRAAFFNSLGFGREPPQPARLPLVFQLAEGLSENLAIPAGTQVVSEPEDDEPEQMFEIAEDEGFEATPARLRRVYSVDRDSDAIFEHQTGAQTALEPRLFAGENAQAHALYVGDTDFLALAPETEFEVAFEGQIDPSVFAGGDIRCSYYGTAEVGGEAVEGWHELDEESPDQTESRADALFRFVVPEGGEFVETTLPAVRPEEDAEPTEEETTEGESPKVTDVESRWIRFEWAGGVPPPELFETRIDEITISLVGHAEPTAEASDSTRSSESLIHHPPLSGTEAVNRLSKNENIKGISPEMLLANDVPLPVDEATGPLYPFGESPHPMDAFYIASAEAFTKRGQYVVLVFESAKDGVAPSEEDAVSHLWSVLREGLRKRAKDDLNLDEEILKELNIPNLELPGNLSDPTLDFSWEYWNGSGWAHLSGVEGSLLGGWVAFDVPDDAQPTAVAGHDHHWIRVRVLEDGYIEYVNRMNVDAKEFEKNSIWQVVSVVVPRFNALSIYYPSYRLESAATSPGGSPAPSDTETEVDPPDSSAGEGETSKLTPIDPPTTRPQHVVSFNNLAYGPDEGDPSVRSARETAGESIVPFRPLPDETQTLYLGFDRPLEDGPVQLLYSAVDKVFEENFYPRARWEFCEAPEADSWARLSAEDGTESLTRRGIVSLVFPESTTAFERFSDDLHWIRARLVGNSFETDVVAAGSGTGEDGGGSALRTSSLEVSRNDPEGRRIVVRNTGSRTVDLSGHRLIVEQGARTRRSRTFPDDTSVPPDESITIGLVKSEEEPSPPDDLSFRFRRNPLEHTSPIELSLRAPAGRLVAVLGVEGEGVDDLDGNERRTVDEGTVSRDTSGPPTLVTGPVATDSPPSLRGLYVNAGWADNVRTVTDERLGSSDGTSDQTFAFANRPAIEERVWVDELSSLLESERTELESERPDDVEEQENETGDPTAFWVRWSSTETFVGSEPDERCYLVDRTAGTITFGDGLRGKIPPRGEDNIRADYRTGGGVDGNVPEATVTALTSALPFVEAVTNPEPGGGGADAETTTAALDRASRTLRDRNRAVAAADFERIASSASRELARVRCIPKMDGDGDKRVGWVTVLLVPRTREAKPVPSPEVVDRVEKAFRRLGPAALGRTRTSPDRIAVRGPNYVETVVETDLVIDPEGVSSVTEVEERATRQLEAFLHPLSGGPDGSGWEFGELPYPSDFYALLERVDGVDHVETLSIAFRGQESPVTVDDDRPELPPVSVDTLVFSGTHLVRAKGEQHPEGESAGIREQ